MALERMAWRISWAEAAGFDREGGEIGVQPRARGVAAIDGQEAGAADPVAGQQGQRAR